MYFKFCNFDFYHYKNKHFIVVPNGNIDVGNLKKYNTNQKLFIFIIKKIH